MHDAPSPTRFRLAFEAGAIEFDAGAFWEAHETWERRWREETQPNARLALQGLIQVAAALHHLFVRGAPEPAARLFAKGLAKLDALPADVEVDLASFRDGIRACARELAEGVPVGSIPRLAAHRA